MNSFFTTMAKIGGSVKESNRRRRRGCWLRILGCFGLLGLLLALLMLLAFAVVGKAGATEVSPPREKLAVQLVIDNSNSMFDKGGVGSDSDLLRMAAARLFIEYLGVDDGRFHPTCGILFFGTQTRLVAPLAPLADGQQRASLVELLREPERMGWTDHLMALEAAHQGLGGVEGRGAIILLTDGKPEWSEQPTPEERTAYLERLAILGRQLGDEEIALFIILLAGPQSEVDREVQSVWEPVWKDMAAATPAGRYLIAHDAQDLPTIYHDIVVALTGRQSDGVVVDDTVAPEGLREAVAVEPGLQRVMLVVRKSHPGTQVTIQLPDGSALVASGHISGPVRKEGSLLEEIWTIEEPVPGTWFVMADGEGRLTVWKDFELAPPTPIHTPTVPAPTFTATPVPTVTNTPQRITTSTPRATETRVAPLVAIATAKPDTSPPSGGNSGRTLWTLLAVVAVIGGGVGGYFVMRRRGRQPIVSGTLQVLDGGGQGLGHKSIDLYEFGKSAVTIGAGESDVRLPELANPMVLHIRNNSGGEPELIIGGNPDVTVNGRRLLTEQVVFDGDLFVIGQTRIRYEDLQRRRPRKRPVSRQDQSGATPVPNRMI